MGRSKSLANCARGRAAAMVRRLLPFGVAQTGLEQAIGFEAAFYLQSNPDVAAAKLEPFQHFLSRGWREGRDPSAAFSLADYRRRYPEVIGADENPLLHQLRRKLALADVQALPPEPAREREPGPARPSEIEIEALRRLNSRLTGQVRTLQSEHAALLMSCKALQGQLKHAKASAPEAPQPRLPAAAVVQIQQ